MNGLNFNISFMGLPNNLFVMIPDLFGISQTCDAPKEALAFMKWMSYGKDGFMQRIAFAQASGTKYFSMPITNDPDVMTAFNNFLTIPGIKEVYADLDNGIVEPVKTLPGYNDSRWNAETGLAIPDADGNMVENATIGAIVTAATLRGFNFADVAQQVNELANAKYTEYAELMK
jgi:multiple sugar transport system substrate-binding protein